MSNFTMNKRYLVIFSFILGGLFLAACSAVIPAQMGFRPVQRTGTGAETAPISAADLPAGISPEAVELFATTCSGCHGAAGQGSTIAPPLNSPELRARLDDEALMATIRNGRPGTQMPAWGRTLSDAQIASLVALIRNWDSLEESQLEQMADQAQFSGCGPMGGMMGRGMMGGMMGRGHGGMMGPGCP